MSAMRADDANTKWNERFCGDIRGLLKRHHVPYAGECDLKNLGEVLFTNAAFRCDLFALCSSISHMAENDLNADELLDVVVASYGPGLTASEENRLAFSSAYQGWQMRELATQSFERSVEAPAAPTAAVQVSEMDQTLQRISESSLELKLFLADVKQRVTEIDPELQHLEQMITQMKLTMPAAAVEPAFAAPVRVSGDERVRVRRLWVAVAVLSAALGLTLGGAAWMAHEFRGSSAAAPVTIVDGVPNQPALAPASAGKRQTAAVGARGTERSSRGAVLSHRATAAGGATRAETPVAARVPAPIIRRSPDARPAAETHGPGEMEPIFVPASTMIGYALASPKPRYPAVSVPDDKASRVEVQATISPAGEVVATRVLSGPILFRDAAEQALQGWRFRPYLVDGSAVKVSTTVAFVFRSMPAT